MDTHMPVLLSEHRFGNVSLCKCGNVTVSFGNASMRVHKNEFVGFMRMVDEAFGKVAAEAFFWDEKD